MNIQNQLTEARKALVDEAREYTDKTTFYSVSESYAVENRLWIRAIAARKLCWELNSPTTSFPLILVEAYYINWLQSIADDAAVDKELVQRLEQSAGLAVFR